MAEETEVIRRVVDGDLDSFRLLVKRYERPIARLIGNLVADRHQGEDLLQDVFLTAFERLHRFDPQRAAFSTWLFAIARNKCINALKKKRPLPTAEMPAAVRGRTPYDDLAEKELFEQFDAALETLPPAQKIAFVLAEFVGLSCAEISQIEGVGPGTVRSRISRAKERLRSLLRQYARGET